MKGTETVVGGITKGLEAVGGGIAKSVNFGVQQYKKTDYAKKKEDEARLKPESATKSASVGVGKAVVHAFGSVVSGVKHGATSVVTDIRDSSVERVAHREGLAAAEKRYKRWDMVGHVSFAGVNSLSLVKFVTPASLVALGTSVAIKVGQGIASYDADKKHVLFGGAWRAGWVSIRISSMEGYQSRWLVLKNFSLAWYKSPEDHWRLAEDYIKLPAITKIREVDRSICHKELSFEVTLNNRFQYFSLECPDNPSWNEMKDTISGAEVEAWVVDLSTLTQANRKRWLDEKNDSQQTKQR